MFDMTEIDKLNSATKYPSIPTYHALDERGALTEERTVFDGSGGTVFLTEKIDGTNGRIVMLPDEDDYFIGSREMLLYVRGDRIANPAEGIVAALKPLADRLADGIRYSPQARPIITLYLEVYGGKIGRQAKQYSGRGTVGYRLFDLAVAEMGVLGWERERISAWREGGGQEFVDGAALQDFAGELAIPLVPYVGFLDGDELPKDVEGMAALLAQWLPESQAELDETAGGRPEGLVLRDSTRSRIAKARFQDYDRTLKRRQQQR